MRYLGTVLVILGAGVWLGGIVCVAVFAQSTFKVLEGQREIAGTVTSRMFVLFGWIQLSCAAAGLLGAFLMYAAGRGGWAVGLFAALAGAAVGAVAYNQWLVPMMEELRKTGQSTGPKFQQLHHYSRWLLQGVGVLLLLAISIAPRAMRAKLQHTATTVEAA